MPDDRGRETILGSTQYKRIPALDCVVVNWNSRDYLSRCVHSLSEARASSEACWKVVVVDNASTDGSATGLEANGLGLTVVQNRENLGFAVACNRGAREGCAPVILFLNPDMQIPAGAIDAALAFLDAPGNERVGIVGAKLTNGRGEVVRCAARTPTPARLVAQSAALDRLCPRLFPPHFMAEWDHSDTRAVDQVIGAFLMIRRPLFAALGGFDERFFLYYEDVDLCLRARVAGWTVMHFAGATAIHVGGGTTAHIKGRRLFHSLRSRVQFSAKHYGWAGVIVVVLAIVMLEVPARLIRCCLNGSLGEVRDTIEGVVLFAGDLPRLVHDLRRRHGALGPSA